MEKIMLKAVLVLFGQMGIQLKFTAKVKLKLMELNTLGGKNVAPGMDLNVNQRVINANSLYVMANVESRLDLSQLAPNSQLSNLASKLGFNVESSEKLIIRVEFLLLS